MMKRRGTKQAQALLSGDGLHMNDLGYRSRRPMRSPGDRGSGREALQRSLTAQSPGDADTPKRATDDMPTRP